MSDATQNLFSRKLQFSRKGIFPPTDISNKMVKSVSRPWHKG